MELASEPLLLRQLDRNPGRPIATPTNGRHVDDYAAWAPDGNGGWTRTGVQEPAYAPMQFTPFDHLQHPEWNHPASSSQDVYATPTVAVPHYRNPAVEGESNTPAPKTPMEIFWKDLLR